jgi:short-subunit dehydrogenase
MTYAVIGASAGIGRALSDALAARGHDLVLVASDPRDLAAAADHLKLTRSIAVSTVAVDFSEPGPAVAEVAAAIRGLDDLAGVLCPIGYSAPDDDGMLGDEAQRILNINLGAVIALAAMFLPVFLSRDRGSIVAFGSVAAIRGRRRNAAYAAAKRGLRSYFESLLCVTNQTAVEVQLYELGRVATGQTLGRSFFLPAVKPERVAARVVHCLDSGSRITYLPSYWRLLSPALRLVPRTIFCRLPI